MSSSGPWPASKRRTLAPILEVLVRARSDMDRQSIRADLESHTAGRRLFLEKHAGLLASKKGATARHHLQIGQRFASAGKVFWRLKTGGGGSGQVPHHRLHLREFSLLLILTSPGNSYHTGRERSRG